MKFMERLRRFFSERYGGDPLNTVLSGFSLVSFLTGLIVVTALNNRAGTILGAVFYLIALAALVFAAFRSLSRNKSARRAEYEWYRSRVSAPIARRKKEAAARRAQRATHRFYRCPKCRQTVRVPRGKGKIRITCPKCGETFIKKT